MTLGSTPYDVVMLEADHQDPMWRHLLDGQTEKRRGTALAASALRYLRNG
jgi:hypothetical protein